MLSYREDLMTKNLLGALATVLTIVSFIPYIRSIRQGQAKPHVFSWIVWGTATCIVFAAQLADGGGVGAWSIGLSGLLTFYVALLAYQRASEITITKSDRVFFILAMGSIPLWFLTRNALWSVILLSVIDTLGFIPTFRKAYHAPRQEPLTLYSIITVRNLVSIAALEHYSWTTILFPAVVSLTCLLFIAMVRIKICQLS